MAQQVAAALGPFTVFWSIYICVKAGLIEVWAGLYVLISPLHSSSSSVLRPASYLAASLHLVSSYSPHLFLCFTRSHVGLPPSVISFFTHSLSSPSLPLSAVHSLLCYRRAARVPVVVSVAEGNTGGGEGGGRVVCSV